MSEYQLQRAAIKEYEEALRLKNIYSEAVEFCAGLLREIVGQYEREGRPIPSRVHRFMLTLLKEVDEGLPTRLPQPITSTTPTEAPLLTTPKMKQNQAPSRSLS